MTAAAATARIAGLRSTVPAQRAHSVRSRGPDPRRPLAPLTAAQHAHPEDAEQRGEQGDRGEHGEDDGEGGGDRQAVQEADAQDQDAEQGDAHRAAREQHGAAGGVDGLDRRLLGSEPGLQAATVPGDDEQGIVDAHAEADQGAEDRREVDDVDRVGQRRDRHQPAADPDDGGDYRQQHRQQRAERDEQHHCGGEHADRRADAQRRLLGLLDGLAAELDVEPGRAGRFGGVDDPGDVRLGQVVGRLAKLTVA